MKEYRKMMRNPFIVTSESITLTIPETRSMTDIEIIDHLETKLKQKEIEITSLKIQLNKSIAIVMRLKAIHGLSMADLSGGELSTIEIRGDQNK